MSQHGAGDFSDYLLHELWRAYYSARLGKRHTMDEHRFEIRAADNILDLRDSILQRRYSPSKGVAFIVHDPVMREIVASPFRDRVVHHFLFNICVGWWDRRFIYDSYSCRPGKGTLFAQKRLEHHICKAGGGYQHPVFVAKLDIQGYFMSLKHDKLYARVLWGLDRQFHHCASDDMANGINCKPHDRERLYKIVKFLWRQIIYDEPMKGVAIRGRKSDWQGLPKNKSLFFQPPGQGIVIGNLTSQSLSNIYLDLLDRFVTLELGYQHYGRYVDDFFIAVPIEQKEQLLRDVSIIEAYLRDELGLTLHPNKRQYQLAERGIPFVGAVVYPGRILPGRRIKRNFYEAAEALTTHGKGSPEGIKSRIGSMKHINSRKFLRRAFEAQGWDYGWLPEAEFWAWQASQERWRPGMNLSSGVL